jgi:hypothetical protein
MGTRCLSVTRRAVAAFALAAAMSASPDAALPAAATKLTGLRIVSADAASKSFTAPQNAIDGDPRTEFTFAWANGGASLVIDLGRPCVIEAARVTNGQTNCVNWVREIAVGPDPEHLRDLLGRPINLYLWRGGDTVEIPLLPSAARFVRIAFSGGGETGAISEVAFIGRENFPERHLMCWSGDIKRDFLDKLDYLDHDLGVTDLWLDYVETAFPQSNRNSGFQLWKETGALEKFRRRGIRYWLAEHEAFTAMVNAPEDLDDDLKWETTFRQMRRIYAQARALGFRGLVLDAEDYEGVAESAKQKYADVADVVDAWTFADEFGPAGMYYQRGLQFGRVLKGVWDCPLLQVYEARAYAGKDDCRAGNYWWLKGIHDAGIEIWIATERTYGAGRGEIADQETPEHLRRWFVRMDEYLPKIHAAYPFAARVLPGFHPWNTRTRKPSYLPQYLDEQLSIARDCALGYWIYNEGNAHAGDPRDVLDRAFCKRYGVTPEEYLRVFAGQPTSRSGPRKRAEP